MWTRFMDMHSGGGQKLDWPYIFIEAPEAEAAIIFQNRFGRNPYRVTCTCCGDDYSLSEEESLEQATAYERNCAYVYLDAQGVEHSQEEAWVSGKGTLPGFTGQYVEHADPKRHYAGPHKTLDEYLASGKVHIILAADIKPEERTGELQEEGYVWRE